MGTGSTYAWRAPLYRALSNNARVSVRAKATVATQTFRVTLETVG
jgi:hypothetical protein